MSTPKQTWKRPCLVVKDGNRNSLNERSSRMPWINSPWHLSQAPGLFQLHHTWLGSGGTFDYLSPEMVPRLKLKILTDPNCEASSCLVCKGITYIHITYTKNHKNIPPGHEMSVFKAKCMVHHSAKVICQSDFHMILGAQFEVSSFFRAWICRYFAFGQKLYEGQKWTSAFSFLSPHKFAASCTAWPVTLIRFFTCMPISKHIVLRFPQLSKSVVANYLGKLRESVLQVTCKNHYRKHQDH